MKLPPLKRLTVEEFPSQQQSWIGKLLYPLNQVFLALSSGLKNGITFQDNIAAQVYTTTFNNNSAELPIIFKSTLQSKPTGLWVVNVVDVSSTPQALTGAVFAQWDYDSANNQFRITSITGLVSAQTYQLTILGF